MRKNGIKVDLEGFLYLQDLSCQQRSNKGLSDKSKERIKRLSPNGAELYDKCLGGAENGKWTSWTCADMKRILDKAGFTYSECEIEMMGI